MDLIYQVIQEAAKRPSYERYGQRLYNALSDLDYDVAEQILFTNCDPFYNDDKVEVFFGKLVELTLDKD